MQKNQQKALINPYKEDVYSLGVVFFEISTGINTHHLTMPT